MVVAFVVVHGAVFVVSAGACSEVFPILSISKYHKPFTVLYCKTDDVICVLSI